MNMRLIACGAVLCFGEPAFADDVIYNGLHCNSLCQWWMGIDSTGSVSNKSHCSYVVSHPDQFDDDLLRLCQAAVKRPQ
jgi:hypothetical protein